MSIHDHASIGLVISSAQSPTVSSERRARQSPLTSPSKMMQPANRSNPPAVILRIDFHQLLLSKLLTANDWVSTFKQVVEAISEVVATVMVGVQASVAS